MKTIVILLIVALSSLHLQEVEKTVATYDRYDDYIFYFTDSDGHSLEFERKDEAVWKKYDLVVGDYYGKKFEITYTVEVDEDDEGEEIYTSTIVDLKLLD
ncbi:hypothetical protein ACOKFD_07800 [Flagellimonas sp. S174]|uniref:hypothetical protein n=1 Tax=Flagellimonas sp. S174 TaxID=3410790 RepID=UPI003BF4BD0C